MGALTKAASKNKRVKPCTSRYRVKRGKRKLIPHRLVRGNFRRLPALRVNIFTADEVLGRPSFQFAFLPACRQAGTSKKANKRSSKQENRQELRRVRKLTKLFE